MKRRTLVAFFAGLAVIPLLVVIWAGWYGFYSGPGARAIRYFNNYNCPKAMVALEELLQRPYLSMEDRELYSNTWEACYSRLHPHDPTARNPVIR